MKNLIRVVLFAIVAFTASPLMASGSEIKNLNEPIILPANTTVNKTIVMKDADENNLKKMLPLKKHPIKNNIHAIKTAARDGDVLIISADAALLIVIILLLILIF